MSAGRVGGATHSRRWMIGVTVFYIALGLLGMVLGTTVGDWGWQVPVVYAAAVFMGILLGATLMDAD